MTCCTRWCGSSAVGMLQINAGLCGGITGALRLAACATACGIAMTTQCHGTAVLQAASLHLGAARRAVSTVEYHMFHRIFTRRCLRACSSRVDGCMDLDERPGLGIDDGGAVRRCGRNGALQHGRSADDGWKGKMPAWPAARTSSRTRATPRSACGRWQAGAARRGDGVGVRRRLHRRRRRVGRAAADRRPAAVRATNIWTGCSPGAHDRPRHRHDTRGADARRWTRLAAPMTCMTACISG